jgi:hypothetical protein
VNPGNVSGTVVDLDTQVGVEGAVVAIGGMQDATDADGRYAIANLVLGASTIAITKSGYTPLSAPVDVTENTTFDAVLVSTQPPPGPPAVISGTVSLSGASAAVTVEAIDQVTQVTEDTVTLAGPGGYGLNVPGAATYTVRASAPGYQMETQTVALPHLGDTASDVDFALSP